MKCKYMFMFTLKNLARKELKNGALVPPPVFPWAQLMDTSQVDSMPQCHQQVWYWDITGGFPARPQYC